jgi:hypothetical protein
MGQLHRPRPKLKHNRSGLPKDFIPSLTLPSQFPIQIDKYLGKFKVLCKNTSERETTAQEKMFGDKLEVRNLVRMSL